MADLFDLSGKTSLVVGVHGGIGKAVALGMADTAADVVELAVISTRSRK